MVVLQDVLKMSDIEADNAVIEGHCFDMPRDDKKQWIYLIFKKNCTIIDVTGRIHGTKKNLHDCRITAIAALGSSDYVITGDEKGLCMPLFECSNKFSIQQIDLFLNFSENVGPEMVIHGQFSSTQCESYAFA